jgi:hypothetical protein
MLWYNKPATRGEIVLVLVLMALSSLGGYLSSRVERQYVDDQIRSHCHNISGVKP